MTPSLPRLPGAAALIAGFARVLRDNAFPIAPEQTETFLRATAALGPRGIGDVRQAALAALAPQPDRRADFEALFLAYFNGSSVLEPMADGEEEQAEDAGEVQPESDQEGTTGDSASAVDLVQRRDFAQGSSDDALRRFGALLRDGAPRRRSYRLQASPRGTTIHLRRSLREIVRNDGDIPTPAMTVKPTRPRKVLVFIDISGSMKGATQDYLRLSHRIVQTLPEVEVFTFATRLARITPALRDRNEGSALARASALVVDWDGGTRIGPSLATFLDVPRYVGHARGAAVLMISDGMERGDVTTFVQSVGRISRLAWRLTWASPLVADPRYQPKTRAMRKILDDIDELLDGSSLSGLMSAVLGWSRAAERRPRKPV